MHVCTHHLVYFYAQPLYNSREGDDSSAIYKQMKCLIYAMYAICIIYNICSVQYYVIRYIIYIIYMIAYWNENMKTYAPTTCIYPNFFFLVRQSLSRHWANQSLPYPNNARKRQVSILKSLAWFDGVSNPRCSDSLISQNGRRKLYSLGHCVWLIGESNVFVNNFWWLTMI